MLAETAHNAGVITNEEFAIFQNAGYMVDQMLKVFWQQFIRVCLVEMYICHYEEKVANLLFNEIGNSQVV